MSARRCKLCVCTFGASTVGQASVCMTYLGSPAICRRMAIPMQVSFPLKTSVSFYLREVWGWSAATDLMPVCSPSCRVTLVRSSVQKREAKPRMRAVLPRGHRCWRLLAASAPSCKRWPRWPCSLCCSLSTSPQILRAPWSFGCLQRGLLHCRKSRWPTSAHLLVVSRSASSGGSTTTMRGFWYGSSEAVPLVAQRLSQWPGQQSVMRQSTNVNMDRHRYWLITSHGGLAAMGSRA
mmetsp:Transcript_68377/g.222409  ORF Transcript_68377/g.222409 Transcript_68377/m.222409 type:complete len:236 (-) Transcript_68377:853-1560(-)